MGICFILGCLISIFKNNFKSIFICLACLSLILEIYAGYKITDSVIGSIAIIVTSVLLLCIAILYRTHANRLLKAAAENEGNEERTQITGNLRFESRTENPSIEVNLNIRGSS
jgi:protein-S-isoprenylcysteine O-methyltransferase Ste14